MKRILSHYKWRFLFQETEHSNLLGVKPLFYYNSYHVFKQAFDSDFCDKNVFNAWIEDTWRLIKRKEYYDPFLCHLVAQYEYIYDEHGYKTCDHILSVEQNLTDNLTNLFRQYIDETFEWKPEYWKNKAKHIVCPDLTIQDISDQNAQMLNDHYRKDFENLF